jgi:O-antigen biosynthesis protein
MKSLLIKLGKALNTIKKEGIASGFRKIFRGLKSYADRIESGDVLIVTNGTGDSALYRTHHVAEELNLHRIRTSVAVQDNPRVLGCLDNFKIFIFHRTVETEKIKKLIEEIKNQKKEIIFETDDLTFDPELLKQSDYLKNINKLEKKQYENGLGAFILNDPYVKACTTATKYLSEKLRVYGKQVFIVPNKLSDEDLKIVDQIKEAKKLQAKSYKLKIGYFSGTISHNKDFATIEIPLLKILEKYPKVELMLAGPLEISEDFGKYKDRIIRLPYVNRRKHFENISGIDINLAPLELNNPFCEAKSELKFFEAGILGVPTVAVANQTFSEAIQDGEDGYLAKDENEWFGKIEKLITDENLRQSMGEKAREKAMRDYTNKNSRDEECYRYLRSKIAD